MPFWPFCKAKTKDESPKPPPNVVAGMYSRQYREPQHIPNDALVGRLFYMAGGVPNDRRRQGPTMGQLRCFRTARVASQEQRHAEEKRLEEQMRHERLNKQLDGIYKKGQKKAKKLSKDSVKPESRIGMKKQLVGNKREAVGAQRKQASSRHSLGDSHERSPIVPPRHDDSSRHASLPGHDHSASRGRAPSANQIPNSKAAPLSEANLAQLKRDDPGEDGEEEEPEGAAQMPRQFSTQEPREGPVRLGRNDTGRLRAPNHLTALSPNSVTQTDYGSFQAAGEGRGESSVAASSKDRMVYKPTSNGGLPRSSLRSRQDTVVSSDLYTWVDHAATCKCGDCETDRNSHAADCRCSECGWEDEEHDADCGCGHCMAVSQVKGGSSDGNRQDSGPGHGWPPSVRRDLELDT